MKAPPSLREETAGRGNEESFLNKRTRKKPKTGPAGLKTREGKEGRKKKNRPV